MLNLEQLIPDRVREALSSLSNDLSNAFTGDFQSYRLDVLIEGRSVQLSFFGVTAESLTQELTLNDDLETHLGAAMLRLIHVVPKESLPAVLSATFTKTGVSNVVLRAT